MVVYMDKYPDLETAYEDRVDDKQDSMLQVRWGRKYVEEVKENVTEAKPEGPFAETEVPVVVTIEEDNKKENDDKPRS